MNKDELKAVIKANFENNEFETAMELNKELFQQYEAEAGKRSLASLISYYRKKVDSVTSVEENVPQSMDAEAISSEQVGEIAEIFSDEQKKPKEAVKETEEPTHQFSLDSDFDIHKIEELLKSENKALRFYCITKEEFRQVSDEEQYIHSDMFIKQDGYGWDKMSDVNNEIKDRDLKSYRKPGSFYNSQKGLPVGEIYVKYTIYKVKDALERFAFRNNESAIKCVTSL